MALLAPALAWLRALRGRVPRAGTSLVRDCVRCCRFRLLAVLVAFLLGLPARAQTQPAPEYQVKAVFLFNFAQFVEWPTESFTDATAPIVIGVLGDNPFGSYLDELVKGEKVGQRRLEVRVYHKAEEVQACHILFVSASELGSLDALLTQLKGHSLLSVSDVDGFLHRGGMVRFATEAGRIRLRINLEAAKAAHLTLSSKLLRASILVAEGKD